LQNPISNLKSEDGVVVVASLMILVLLTIIGVVSINYSNTEVQIAGNELVSQQNFYIAEGAALLAVEELESKTTDIKNNIVIDWLEDDTLEDMTAYIFDSDFWDGALTLIPEPTDLDDSQFVAQSNGVAFGSSLDVTATTVHAFSIYGRCAPPQRGATTVHIGYLIAY
jgi:hypothetical protein